MATALMDKNLFTYNQVSSAVRSSSALESIYVYVEDGIDAIFWRYFLQPYENEFKFIVSPVQKEGLDVCGKNSIFKAYPPKVLNPTMWACIDADYDNLIDGYFRYEGSPFIIRTSTYSIENLKCDYSLLDEYIYKCTLASNIDSNYKEYLRIFSKSMIPLLALSLTSEKYNIAHPTLEHVYSIKDFDGFVNRISIELPIEEYKNYLEAIINKEIVKYQDFIKKNKDDFYNFIEHITKASRNGDYAYMYMNGHTIEHFVKQLLCKESIILFKNKLEILKTSENKQDVINKYLNSVHIGKKEENDGNIYKRIENLISDSSHFETCAYTERIKSDIANVIAHIEQYEESNATLSTKR